MSRSDRKWNRKKQSDKPKNKKLTNYVRAMLNRIAWLRSLSALSRNASNRKKLSATHVRLPNVKLSKLLKLQFPGYLRNLIMMRQNKSAKLKRRSKRSEIFNTLSKSELHNKLLIDSIRNEWQLKKRSE